MEVTLEPIDWQELTKFTDTASFAEWRLNQEDEPDWILSEEDSGWLSDSGYFYLELAEALKEMADGMPPDEAAILRGGLMKIVPLDKASIVCDFPCVPDSCYFMALSPASVKSAAGNLEQLDTEPLVAALAGNAAFLGDDYVDAGERQEVIAEYIEQVQAVVRTAESRGWGILGFAG